MFETVLYISAFILSASILGATYRVIKGPSMPDRVIALDSIGVCLIGIIAIVSVLLDTNTFSDVILLIGILAFIGTVSFSKFIEKGVVIERKRD